jgi:hypothetical protein
VAGEIVSSKKNRLEFCFCFCISRQQQLKLSAGSTLFTAAIQLVPGDSLLDQQKLEM